MAKVMISLPDDLLAQVDAVAAQRGLTRSALIRECVDAAFDERTASLAARMRALNAEVSRGHGGDVVADLKASRATLDR
ncbi:MAG: ribbon-helix-helix protein, CopG family [Solirubrobacteraceae bacterium]|nr:ribbon-helix-helix protein, CopG family [Solirubrobacteraceae bacterium]